MNNTIDAIKRLPKKQREAFDLICVNQDVGLHPATAKALVRKGLVEQYDAIMHFKDGLGPMRVKRHRVSIPLHMAWCYLCSEELDGEAE